MSWQKIRAIGQLQQELDDLFPNRVTPDWIIGDADHSSRVSDHNPAPDGDVHAIDIRLGGDLNVRRVLNALIGDRRVWYVIYNGIIYSRTYGWRARKYLGSNPHRTHIHASFRYAKRYENDTSKFFEDRKRRTKPTTIDLSIVRNQFLIYLGEKEGERIETVNVRRLQRCLVQRAGAKLEVDGWVGKNTLNAWGEWERSLPGKPSGRPRVPDRKSLGALTSPRWEMIA